MYTYINIYIIYINNIKTINADVKYINIYIYALPNNIYKTTFFMTGSHIRDLGLIPPAFCMKCRSASFSFYQKSKHA